MPSPEPKKAFPLTAGHFSKRGVGRNSVMRINISHSAFHAPHFAHVVGGAILHPAVVIAIEPSLILRRHTSPPSAATVPVAGSGINAISIMVTMPGSVTRVIPVSVLFTVPGTVAVVVPTTVTVAVMVTIMIAVVITVLGVRCNLL